MANARYSPRHQQASALTVFPVGSLVWKLYNKPDEHIGRTTPKLHVIWKGPYRVLNISEDNTEYHWVHALSRTYVYSLIKLLIEYLSEEEILDSAVVPLADDQARIVEEILSYTCKRNKNGVIQRRTLRFKIKLSGVEKPEWFI